MVLMALKPYVLVRPFSCGVESMNEQENTKTSNEVKEQLSNQVSCL